MEHEVRFERGPAGGDRAPAVRVCAGATLMDAVREAGLPLARACDGDGLCARCGVQVLRGEAVLSEESESERSAKARNRIDPELRLSCCSEVRGAVTVAATYW